MKISTSNKIVVFFMFIDVSYFVCYNTARRMASGFVKAVNERRRKNFERKIETMNGTSTNDKSNKAPEDAPASPSICAQSPLDVTYEVTAPENVGFQYYVAGPFSRTAAYTSDIFVMFVYWLGVTIGVCSLVERLFGWEGVLGYAPKTSSILLDVFYFLHTMFVFWFWNALFEAFCQGRTPGKALVGLRVISCSGRPLRLSQALVRNVLRLADFALGPFVVLAMGLNDRMARLGDVAADTVVVVNRRKTKKFKRGKKGERAVTEPFDENLLANVTSKIPEEFVIGDSLRKALELYVSRRSDLAPQPRLEIAKTLADSLQDKMNISPRLNPDVFLYALHQISLGMNRQTF